MVMSVEERREKQTTYMRIWREKNRDRHNESARKSHQRNRYKNIEKMKEYHLQTKYNISLKDKLEMIQKQDYKCFICKEDFANDRSTHVDHDHTTGKVRAILCHRCNTKLGWYEKYKDVINSYLDMMW